MKLASYMADGKACFGVVTDDGVVTLNQRLGYASLRDALTTGGLAEKGKARAAAQTDHKRGDVKRLPGIPKPEKNLSARPHYPSPSPRTGRELARHPPRLIPLPD